MKLIETKRHSKLNFVYEEAPREIQRAINCLYADYQLKEEMEDYLDWIVELHTTTQDTLQDMATDASEMILEKWLDRDLPIDRYAIMVADYAVNNLLTD